MLFHFSLSNMQLDSDVWGQDNILAILFPFVTNTCPTCFCLTLSISVGVHVSFFN